MRVLTGLIGSGIGSSGSPAIHEREARALGFQLHYQLMALAAHGRSLDQLPQLLDAAEMLGFSGVNITHPCKQSVIAFLDGLSAEAEAIGAVNTVVFRAGRKIGHNTDWHGFQQSLRQGLPGVRKESVLILGAGGAGCAVCYAALRLGIRHVFVHDLDTARAQRLVDHFTSRFREARIAVVANIRDVIPRVDGLIHATPVGMECHPGIPVAPNLLRAELWVADLVYFPLETELLRAARAKGCQTLDGGAMAVFQAAEAFRLFTGVEPDSERMLRQFREAAGWDRPGL
jgi:shikimate dehydrogenase